MDIQNNRRANLRAWVAKNGTPQKEKSYFSQLIGGTTSFGERAARRLERDYKMGDGYLDNPVAAREEQPTPGTPGYVWPFPSISADAVQALPEQDRQKLEGAIGLALAQLGIGLPVAKASSSKVQEAAKVMAQAAAANDPDYVAIRRVSVRITGGLAGFSVDAEDDGNGGVIYLPRTWLERRGINPERGFAAKVKGYSMAPRVTEDDIVIINPDDKTRKIGKVFALNHDGEFTLKRLDKRHGRWYLVSDNLKQQAYPPIPCSDMTRIIGTAEVAVLERI